MYRLPGLFSQFELDGAMSLFLEDGGPCQNLSVEVNVSETKVDQITTP